MATTYQGAKRTDMFTVDPNQIIVKEENRGRQFPPEPEDIIELAYSMHKFGQSQPVQCRKGDGDRLILNLGFTRTAAARLIRDGFDRVDTNNVTEHIHDPEFLLKATVVNGNDEKAFMANIEENRRRNVTSVIDDAHNQERLRDRYAQTDQEIAKTYNYSVATVQRNARLLALSKEHQYLVHTGKLPIQAALDLLDMPEENRSEALEVALKTDDSGKVDATKIRQQVRDHHLRDSADKVAAGTSSTSEKPSETPQAGKFKPRSPKELKDMLEVRSREDGISGDFAKVLIEYMAGRMTDSEFTVKWDKLLG